MARGCVYDWHFRRKCNSSSTSFFPHVLQILFSIGSFSHLPSSPFCLSYLPVSILKKEGGWGCQLSLILFFQDLSLILYFFRHLSLIPYFFPHLSLIPYIFSYLFLIPYLPTSLSPVLHPLFITFISHNLLYLSLLYSLY